MFNTVKKILHRSVKSFILASALSVHSLFILLRPITRRFQIFFKAASLTKMIDKLCIDSFGQFFVAIKLLCCGNYFQLTYPSLD